MFTFYKKGNEKQEAKQETKQETKQEAKQEAKQWSLENFEEEESSPENSFDEEINPNEMKVICKKYIDSDDDDAIFRVMILQDTKTKEEYVIFDNLSEFVVRSRYKKKESNISN